MHSPGFRRWRAERDAETMDALFERAISPTEAELTRELATLAASAARHSPTAGQFRVHRRGRTVRFTFDPVLCASGADQPRRDRDAVRAALHVLSR
jgi:hypothetical protein